MEYSLIELWDTMGWFAKGVVFVLLLMSIFTASTALRKVLQLHRERRASRRFAPRFPALLARGEYGEAERLIAEQSHSHLAAAFRGVLRTLELEQREQPISPSEIAAAERLIELNTLERSAQMRRGLSLLATVGATAPFVGLLGTTMGVVHAFTGMAASGSGGLAAISAGIAEALIVTALGLLVAIPAVWLYNYFVNQIDQAGLEINYATKQFLDFMLRFRGYSAAERNGRRAEPPDLEPIALAGAAGEAPSLSGVS